MDTNTDVEMKYYITLINSNIHDFGKEANDCATYVCDEMWKMRIPIAGFILKKDSGMYVIVGEDFAKELTKFWHNPCISFDLMDFISHTQEPFWLVDYENGDETKPRLMYYFK